jgi:predicted transcriptional regulator
MSELILKHEKLVYEIIQDYLGNRRPLEVDKLIPVINSKLSKKSIDLNPKGIEKIVKSLLKKKHIVNGSILTKDEILENETRKIIYDFVCENQVVYFHQIMKGLDLPSHNVVWHLNLLFLFGFINRIKIEKHYNHYIYYNNNLSGKDARKLYFTNNVKCKEIIEYLRNNNHGCSKTHLSKQLGIHPNTIKKYIDALEDFEIISKKSVSNKNLIFLNV